MIPEIRHLPTLGFEADMENIIETAEVEMRVDDSTGTFTQPKAFVIGLYQQTKKYPLNLVYAPKLKEGKPASLVFANVRDVIGYEPIIALAL